jgi:hypothetical protein
MNWMGETLVDSAMSKKDAVSDSGVVAQVAGSIGVSADAAELLAGETAGDGKPLDVSTEVSEVLGLDSQDGSGRYRMGCVDLDSNCMV